MPGATANSNSSADVPSRHHEGEYYINGADLVVCVRVSSHRVSCRRLRQ